MPQFINYLLLFLLAAYMLMIVIELMIKRAFKKFAFEVLAVFVVVLVLKISVDFPSPKQPFGGASPLAAIGLMFFSIVLGIVANYFFYNQTLSWRSLSRPVLISPIILLPLIGTIQTSSQIESIQLVSLSILAFQNGFFWKIVFERVQKTMGAETGK